MSREGDSASEHEDHCDATVAKQALDNSCSSVP
jgi:hypothetical protein